MILQGKKVLITQAEDFMGPTLVEVFREQGAEVIADTRALSEPGAAGALIAEAGEIDALVANLSIHAPSTPAVEVTGDEWR